MSYSSKPESGSDFMPDVKALEDAVKAFLGVEEKEVVALSSKMAALFYALTGVGVGAGDEVCVPCVGAEDVVDAVLELGAVPVLVGVEACTTGCEDGEALDSGGCGMYAVCLEDAIRERIEVRGVKPKVIVMRSGGGVAGEVGVDAERGGAFSQIHMICEIAFRYNIPIIDDACGVVPGAEFYGRKLGTFGWRGYGILDVADSPGGIALVCDGIDGKNRVLDLMPVAF